MHSYAAFLRAVNVGGTGKLPMTELSSMCHAAGFERVKTYIASGNVVFKSASSPAIVQSELERRLLTYAGKPVGVLVRTAFEMRAILDRNPYQTAPPNYTHVIFLNESPPKDALNHIIGGQEEEIALGERELYVHYPLGMGKSKLKIPAAKLGTARNMNTVAKLTFMASELEKQVRSGGIHNCGTITKRNV